MPKRVEHTWRETNADGETRFLRATRVAKEWRFASKLQDDEQWTHHETLPEAELRDLRDVLWRKYQRRRIPWEHVVEIDKLLGDDEDAG